MSNMSSIRKILVESPLLRTACVLGEAPLYDHSTHTLHFVDIVQKQVFHLHTKTLEISKEQFEDSITCLAIRRNNTGHEKLACLASKGFALIEENSTLRYLCTPLPSEYQTYTRFNDGACDRKGRFFAGTICSIEHNIPGQLYMYDPEDGKCSVVDPGPFTDSNGLGWSADERTLYFTDSLVNRIYAYDYDDGKISGRRVFVDPLSQGLPEQTFPDGLCIDSEGGIWSARWGGSRIIRYNAEGVTDLEVVFPTALNITACCFGGPNEDQLYVTTAHCGAIGGDASRQILYPDSGHIFVVDLTDQFKGGPWRHAFGG